MTSTITARIHPSGLVTPPTPRQLRPALPDGPPCRCCTQPLETAFQPHWRAGEAGYPIYTCRNRACRMYTQTLAAPDYNTVDLSRYGATEHEVYRAAKAAYEKAGTHG